MKKYKMILFVLACVPLLLTLLVYPILPDTIPAHYNASGIVDRYGSKNEMFLLPVITLVMGFVMNISSKISSKKEQSDKKMNEKITLITGILVIISFIGLQISFLGSSLDNVSNLNLYILEPNRMMAIMFGMTMIILGNLMPKLKTNSWIGFRTTKTMRDEVTWKKSQRFGGITFILAGILILVSGFVLKGGAVVAVILSVLVVMLVVDLIYIARL